MGLQIKLGPTWSANHHKPSSCGANHCSNEFLPSGYQTLDVPNFDASFDKIEILGEVEHI